MGASFSLATEAESFLRTTLRGVGQLAFCDSPSAGLLVLAGVTLTSPFAGLGALLGAMFGTIIGRITPLYTREEWAWGLASFNPAVVGLLSGGFLASGEVHSVVLVSILALSIVFDVTARRFLARLMLPSLSVGALTTVYLVSMVAARPGGWFWTDAQTNALFPFGLLGSACIVAAMLAKSWFAGLWASFLSAVTALSAWLTGSDPQTLIGLWGISVPLAAFGVHAIFLRGSLAGCVAGTMAAAAAALTWIAWEASPISQWLPPLLSPFVVGVWLSIAVMRKLYTLPIAHLDSWRVANLLFAARAADRGIAALVRDISAGTDHVSGFLSGTWLDPQMPRSAFEIEKLRESHRCRQAFFDAVDRLRSAPGRDKTSSLWAHLARLERDGWLHGIVVQDVVMPAEVAELPAVVSLHGALERVRCLSCGDETGWPPRGIWRRCDLRCPSCEGALSPALTLFGSAIAPAVSTQIREVQAGCAVLLVLGEEAGEPATFDFLEQARRAGAMVVFVSDRAPNYPRRPSDLSVCESPGRFLAFLHVALAARRALSGPSTRRNAAPVSGGREGQQASG